MKTTVRLLLKHYRTPRRRRIRIRTSLSRSVPVTGRRFKKTLREEKPPRAQVGNSRKGRPGEVDSAFKIIFCVGNSRLQRLRLPDKHHASIDTIARQPSAEAFILLEWLDSFFLSHCERQPTDGKYHLPNNFTKKEVYDHYRTDMVQVRECLQYSSFKHYWVKFYPLVTIPTTNKFSVCDFCELYKSKRDKGVTSLEKAEVVEALKLHRKQQAEERAAAGRRRWKALDSPKDCAYIQIDGMDQKKTALPHFSKQPKSVDGAALVGVHLVGAMIFFPRHTAYSCFSYLQ
ncbi:hypothetical protein R1sor_016604 [Riccia sorocarpa]|uniref:Uncharacterized protein n=1 Tax=Riccia sorocarpa TaxID=122646 RepID=A0ABD3HJ06_9MARC